MGVFCFDGAIQRGLMGSSALELEQEVLDMTKAVATGICIAKPMYRPLAVL